MMDHNLGVSPVISYELKRIDSDFFDESESLASFPKKGIREDAFFMLCQASAWL